MDCDAVIVTRPRRGNVSLAHVVEHLIHRTLERIAQTAAAGPLDANPIAATKPMIAEAGGHALFTRRTRIDDASAFAAGHTLIGAEGFDGVFVRAHGKTHIIGENSIIARKAQAAAPFPGAARIGNHFKTLDP